MKSTPRILLLAGDVAGNLGDRAIRASLCALLRRVWPGAVPVVLSRDAARDAREFGAEILGATSAALVTRAAVARRCDFAVFGGGQLLQDDSSLVKNLYWALLLWWTRRVLGLRIVGCGLGVGPLETRIGRWLARVALLQLDAFIGRDARSCDYAKQLVGGKIPISQAPDLAMFLGTSSRDEAVNFLAANEDVKIQPGEFVIGVAIRRWFHLKRRVLPYAWTGGEQAGERDERFERMLANIAAALRKFSDGRRVRLLFFCMGEAEWDGDSSFARQVAAATGLPSHVLKLSCPAELIRATTGVCDLFLSVRMHSAMLALSSGVPSAAICYVPKVRDFFALHGLEDCAMRIEDAAAPGGDAQIEALLAHVHESRGRIQERLRESFAAARAKEDVYADALRAAGKPTP